MKKDKRDIKNNVLDAIVELIFTAVCFAIGMFIASLFGVDFNSPDTDYELIILLGVAVLIVSFIVVYALTHLLKKIFKIVS